MKIDGWFKPEPQCLLFEWEINDTAAVVNAKTCHLCSCNRPLHHAEINRQLSCSFLCGDVVCNIIGVQRDGNRDKKE